MRVLHLIIYIMLFCQLPASAQNTAMQKMSSQVRRVAMQQRLSRHMKADAAPSRLMTCFVKSDDIATLQRHDCTILATFGDIYIVSMPTRQLASLAAERSVRRIEAGRTADVLNDKMAEHLNAQKAYDAVDLSHPFTGEGVVMGVQDIGFDLTNPNFYSRDLSEYRIKAFWDMLSEETAGSVMPVGQEYRGEHALQQYSHSRDGYKQLHGTHTLGTAAGSGYDTDYRGLAWGSDICIVSNVVSSDKEFIAEEDMEKYTSALDALGFKYIFDYAESVGKPCVISFSEGSQQDLYGDDVLLYEVLERLQGPGRIIVASAGNSSLEPSYVHKPAGRESAGCFMRGSSGRLYVMAQSSEHFSIRLVSYGAKNDTVMVSSEWLCQQEDTLSMQKVTLNGEEYMIECGGYPSAYNEDNLVMECYIEGPKYLGSTRAFSVEVVGTPADIEMYKILGSIVQDETNPMLNDGIVYANVHSPSSAPGVICVGATSYSTGYVNYWGDQCGYYNGEGGERAYFSSVGPTVDGRTKPDVMAPGMNIVSSGSSYFAEANPTSRIINDDVAQYVFRGRRYSWRADSGTSMSTPAVGGVIALWLQADPTLTHDDVMRIIANTSHQHNADMPSPNNEYGYGEIDAYAGLLEVLQFSGVGDISTQPARGVRMTVRDGMLEVRFDEPLAHAASISAYTTGGVKVAEHRAAKGDSAITMSLTNASGIIAVQVEGVGSRLVRLKVES